MGLSGIVSHDELRRQCIAAKLYHGLEVDIDAHGADARSRLRPLAGDKANVSCVMRPVNDLEIVATLSG